MLDSTENINKKKTKMDEFYSEDNSLLGIFQALQYLYTIEGLWIFNVLLLHACHFIENENVEVCLNNLSV